ncbi:FMN-dependent NADH-azoreductase [Texcoconibacillus texcoconensis]|uniref:FMN dependent NADH:quinone oxidoreductase n=1 Tax=Texcoconibacillus texcoconensis TaxID=1095777 RepID=A0A840QS94_9BACI|nr:NAD(P)H-dependent oxidoreductase [Texcoconibacillus texcoconensis]MBB5174188.1 FMN-dependent NADH-azoreductase [Texcoconibacillus texcoconensis]
MNVLYITANPKNVDDSYSLRLGEHFLNEYRRLRPHDKIEHVDLFSVDLPPLDKDMLSLWDKHSDIEETHTNPFVEQFIQADRYILVTPLWNMHAPSQVKAYIDQLIVPGKTFQFTETSVEGMLSGKKMIHIQSRGGIYSEGKLKGLESANSYIQTIFSLIGVTDYEHVFIEGTSTYPDEAEDRLKEAKESAKQVAQRFSQDQS